MEYISIDEVYKMAKPGDKLQGKLAVYPTGLPESKVDVDELTFWDCISCLLDKPDVIDGADFYLEKLEDETFKQYGIVREVNGVLKAPRQMLYHIVSKYCDIESSGHMSTVDKWEDWELGNYYCENDRFGGTARYTCCINENADAYTEDFMTLIAVWAYLKTDMSANYCHLLDEKVAEIERRYEYARRNK
ncbi:MAG: hypothetical protein ACI35S_05430 [Anaeroplasma sp.]